MDVAVVIFDGVDDLDVFGPFEVLAAAGKAGAEIRVRMASISSLGEVRTSHGAIVRPSGLLDSDHVADVLLVPGGGWNDRTEHGAWAEAQRGDLPELIRLRHRAGAVIASVCTGAGIVAAAGILDGRTASTHHRTRDELRGSGVEIVDARVVDDGDIVTAGGVTSGIDLGLWLVEREAGRELADRIADYIEYERRGRPLLGPNADERSRRLVAAQPAPAATARRR
ncbi:MAG: DJ-1/PfpI family protein [Thermoleophilaceae bacterium]